jgi:hypothetical protein
MSYTMVERGQRPGVVRIGRRVLFGIALVSDVPVISVGKRSSNIFQSLAYEVEDIGEALAVLAILDHTMQPL